MFRFTSKKMLAAAAVICLTASSSWGQSIEQLRQQYEREMKLMQESFQEQLNELRKRQNAILEAMSEGSTDDQEDPALEERVVALEEATQKAENDFKFYWKEGIRFDSQNGDFQLKFGGRIQNDWGWYSLGDELEAAGLEAEDGTEFRRARIYIGGTIYDNFEFKAQYDFAGGDADFKDVFLAHNKVPVFGQIKIGHFKEPFSLEELTSSKDTTFMERALPIVMAPSRNSGIQASRGFANDRMGGAVGIFRDADGYGDGFGDAYNVTARVHGRPYLNEDGDRYVHLGAAVSHVNLDDSIRIRQRPEAHMTDRFVNTGSIMAEEALKIGLEGAAVFGPASIQGEYIHTSIDADSMSDVDVDGFYVQASYFLTGEHRRYKAGKDGKFDRINPKNNFNGFGQGGGKGAWEVAARYSHIDLNDGDVFGGEESNITLGLNWYLNPNMKIMLNYIHGEIEDDDDPADDDDTPFDDDFDAIMARFQVTW